MRTSGGIWRLGASTALAAGLSACDSPARAGTVGSWSLAAPMLEPRCWHSMTVLRSGKVLVAGGWKEWAADGSAAALATAEIYDPASGTWRETASMGTPRTWHVAVLLDRGQDQGRVLVAGGASGFFVGPVRGVTGTYPIPVASAEIFDPATESWAPATSMRFPRVLAFGQRLHDGRVLAANAWWTIGGDIGRETETYDPEARTWGAAGEMPGPDGGPTVLLPSGRVLSVGGWDVDRVEVSRDVAVYQSDAQAWRALAPLPFRTYFHNLTLLGTGKVLLSGGCQSGFYWPCGLLAPLEGRLFDPESETWTPTSTLHYPRFDASSVTLPSGKALVVGGNTSFWYAGGLDYYVTPAAEVYDPWRDVWETTPVMPHYVNYGGALAVLPSGEVIHTGGGIVDGLGFTNDHTKGISATQIFRE